MSMPGANAMIREIAGIATWSLPRSMSGVSHVLARDRAAEKVLLRRISSDQEQTGRIQAGLIYERK
jgi:hypothetical protein